jgi:hypothetical protein
MPRNHDFDFEISNFDTKFRFRNKTKYEKNQFFMKIFKFLVLINRFNNQFYKELYNLLKSVIYVTVISESFIYA